MPPWQEAAWLSGNTPRKCCKETVGGPECDGNEAWPFQLIVLNYWSYAKQRTMESDRMRYLLGSHIWTLLYR